jgi:uncharacterized membrane protein YhaH (DUF805 family)
MGSYFDGMLRYFEFWGRSSRLQYFMFFLVQALMIGVGIVSDYKVRGGIGPDLTHMPVTLFMVLVHFVPGITVQTRRLHDIGKSGGWILLNFVPLGSLVLLYWACRASGDGTFEVTPQFSRTAKRVSTIPAGVRMGSSRGASGSIGDLNEGRFI